MGPILAKLDQNESPIPPPLNLLNEVHGQVLREINRYQRKELYEQVRELYADYIGIGKEYVWIQPGVDLFLEDILMVKGKKKVIVPYPSYFLFIEQVKHYGYDIVRVPLNRTFLKKLIAISQQKENIVYLDNPNNPTGKLIIKKHDIIPILSRGDNIVLIDEAYYEFCNYTVKDLVEDYYNIIVFRTMSKAFGFAGGRVAFCIIDPSLAKNVFYYNIVRFRLPTISLMIAKILLENKDYINNIIDLVKRERSRITHRIEKMGLKNYDSCTNFVMINTGISQIAELLRKEGVLVKDLGKILGDRFAGYIRVTIGLPRENNIFLDALEKIILNYDRRIERAT